MNVVVLGATGQIGSLVVSALARRHHVTGTSRNGRLGTLAFDPFNDDWSRLGTPDIVINCVGQIHASRLTSFCRIHVEVVERILANRRKFGNPSIIQISALGASLDHPVEFLRTKGIADALLLREPRTIIIRPSIVCTHRTMVVKKIRALTRLGRWTGFVPVPEGFPATRIQPVMANDLADLVLRACEGMTPQLVSAVGPDALSFRELIELSKTASGSRFRMFEIPKRVMDVVVGKMMAFAFPDLVNAQQYRLLFGDNIDDPGTITQMLGRPLQSPRAFFFNEFTDATH